MNFNIRHIEPFEHEVAAQFLHDIWHETQAPLQTLQCAELCDVAFFQNIIYNPAYSALIVQADGSLAGLSNWTGTHLSGLYVSKDLRSRGIGNNLLVATEVEMRKTGATQLGLNCVCGNDGARRFYERHGWQVDRINAWESESPPWAKAWHMVKP